MGWIFFVYIFIFRLEPTVREQLDENNFPSLLWYFFSKVPFWNYLTKPCSKFFCNNYKTLWQRHFEAIHYSWKFYEHGWQYELIFLQQISLNEKRRRCLDFYHLHNNPSLLFEENCTKTFHLLLTISEIPWCNVLLRAG